MSQFGVPLDSERINDLTKSRYWRVSVVDSTGSTQVDLIKKVRGRTSHPGDVLATEFQSAGRGRLDRTFVAPHGSALLFSLYILPKSGGSEWGWLPLLAGQSVCDAMLKLLKIDDGPKLKWPNDILINEKKVAGLLAERIETESGVGAVIGIGINVYANRDELPTPAATSLAAEGFAWCDRNELLAAILESFEDHLRRWEDGDRLLIDEYVKQSATIGRKIEIEMPGGEKLTSIAISVDPSGALVLENGRHVTVGDVLHVSAV